MLQKAAQYEELHKLYASLSIYSDDKIKANEIGGACSTHASDEKCVQHSCWKT